jgi:hypothetical protein
MDRRAMLGAMGTGTLGFLASRAAGQPPDPEKVTYSSGLGEMHKKCLNACTACAAVCNEASHHCLGELSKGAEHREHHALSHALTMDCATMCATSAGLIARQSALASAQCTACAEACRSCAEACERDPSGADIMKECARICRVCETSCRDMASHHGHAARRD